MTIEHVNIPDGERHEPKGIDSATAGQVYVSDGANSGSWSKPLASNTEITDTNSKFTGTTVEEVLEEIVDSASGGWSMFEDAGTSAQTVSSTAAIISIDGLGSGNDTTHKPDSIGSDDLWDTTNNKVVPAFVGDVYSLRLVCPITAQASSPTIIRLQVDVGSGATPTDVILDKYCPIVLATNHDFMVEFTLPVDSNFVSNGAKLYLSTDVGTVDIDGSSLLITRIHSGDS